MSRQPWQFLANKGTGSLQHYLCSSFVLWLAGCSRPAARTAPSQSTPITSKCTSFSDATGLKDGIEAAGSNPVKLCYSGIQYDSFLSRSATENFSMRRSHGKIAWHQCDWRLQAADQTDPLRATFGKCSCISFVMDSRVCA